MNGLSAAGSHSRWGTSVSSEESDIGEGAAPILTCFLTQVLTRWLKGARC